MVKRTGFNKTARALLSAALCAGLTATPILARPASSLTDLVGARASSGESGLRNRGFEYQTGNDGQYGTRYSYYWHSGDRNCVQVETYNGRYTAITDATPGDCNQHNGGSAAGAAVAAGVGVAIVAGLLAHRSHHHDDNQHHGDAALEHQYEQGYNEGLSGAAFNNRNNSQQYAEGYNAGSNDRWTQQHQESSRQGNRNRNRNQATTDYIRGPGGLEERCIQRVRAETGVNHVSTNHIEESEAATAIYVNVRGAQDLWRCLGYRDGTIGEVMYMGSEGGA